MLVNEWLNASVFIRNQKSSKLVLYSLTDDPRETSGDVTLTLRGENGE